MRIALPMIAALALATPACAQEAPQAQAQPQEQGNTARTPDVIYVPTPERVVAQMLALAKVGPKDVLYDLGSGDGRIAITAARAHGIRAVGIDIDPQRIAEARANAKAAGVEKLVTFRQADLFTSDISEATVVTLYLLDTLNLKLRPKLLAELKPGTRVVSHAFNMGDWKPEVQQEIDGRTIYLWTIPKR
jgi:precorrin-6B methylase 2